MRIIYGYGGENSSPFEYYSVGYDGTNSARVNGPLVAGGNAYLYHEVFNTAGGTCGGCMAYIADQKRDGINEVFVTTGLFSTANSVPTATLTAIPTPSPTIPTATMTPEAMTPTPTQTVSVTPTQFPSQTSTSAPISTVVISTPTPTLTLLTTPTQLQTATPSPTSTTFASPTVVSSSDNLYLPFVGK